MVVAPEEIDSYYRMLTRILEGRDNGWAFGNWWHPQWIPFAADGMGAVPRMSAEDVWPWPWPSC